MAIKYKATPGMCDDYLAQAPAGVHGLRKLLDHCCVTSSASTAGLTWLEIFILSTAVSHNPFVLLHGTSAQSTVQLAVQLKEFIAASQSF
eukprot:4373505-Karenia_brevis.AAC.1